MPARNALVQLLALHTPIMRARMYSVKACPHQATNCCRKRQQIVARNGNIVAAPVKVAVSGNKLLPFSATLLPCVDRPLGF